MKHYEKIGHVGRHSFSLLARLGRYELTMLLCVAVLSGGFGVRRAGRRSH